MYLPNISFVLWFRAKFNSFVTETSFTGQAMIDWISFYRKKDNMSASEY